ncbi:Uncharacterised protein [Legionella cincinnatiensis]|uniref:Uncharacterized protein n=2 Tax=Legionella cincinnatiensis TaxID=28085 RepID=A0A378IK12_9GAMM|nr:hypothetical protein Lcin_3189 [Legionella cincinnatiensis]STX35406.1 Uncharacterised protein [Legionella cincinnatiensis]
MSALILGSCVSVAATNHTNMHSKWICTTNASSGANYKDRVADDKMAHTKGSAAKSFAFAAKNCRDCIKITCEISD